MEIKVYTDGATSSQSNMGEGPSGWGYIAIIDGKEYRRCCGYKCSTNNRMELMGVIHAIVDLYEYGFLNEGEAINIYTDSQYTITCQKNSKTWLEEGKKDIKNPDLVAKLLYLSQLFDVRLHKVEGHSKDYYNNIADELAVRGRTFPYEKLLDDLPEK